MTIELQFTPWSRFQARKDGQAIRSWLEGVGRASEAAFKKGASRPWFSGKGSSPGEWPMRRSGNLIGSIGYEAGSDSVTVGSAGRREARKRGGRGFDYSSWLRSTGRKMSPQALEEGMKSTQLSRWVEWSRM